MKSTTITRMLTTPVAAAVLSIALASCGGGDSASKDARTSSGNDAAVSSESAAKIGKTFCTAIKTVQADLLPDAKSAAYLAQLTLKLDPAENAKLSAAVVDQATKKECPTEYQKFLDQAQITSLRDVGLQP